MDLHKPQLTRQVSANTYYHKLTVYSMKELTNYDICQSRLISKKSSTMLKATVLSIFLLLGGNKIIEGLKLLHI